MIGGGQIDETVRSYTGADAFGVNAVEAVNLCRGWLAAPQAAQLAA
jgi:5-methyltetrahydrofolate--homocysteine methyltransferase